jgi:DNA-binding CsgD family transcriptional regulator
LSITPSACASGGSTAIRFSWYIQKAMEFRPLEPPSAGPGGLDTLRPPAEAWPRGLAISTAALFAAIILLVVVDLVADLSDGTSLGHVAFEGLVAVAGAVGLVVVLRYLRTLRRLSVRLHREAEASAREAEASAREAEASAREAEASAREAEASAREAEALQARLAATAAEAERWRAEAHHLVAGLGAAIATQLERWGLSPAEQEVALLMLKGLSHKEVADVRGVSEATTRQQARAIYRKAGVAGRNELASFFLEDLLLPTSSVTESA